MQDFLNVLSLNYHTVSHYANDVARWAWSGPVLIWLLGGGLVLSYVSGFIQIRKLFWIILRSFSSHSKQTNGINSKQALLVALGSTIGTGNIIGVALAVLKGGPGAVFWMWLVGFVAMAIKYSEVLASVKFRHLREDGHYSAGPFMYIQGAFGHYKLRKLGKFLAICYALAMSTMLISAGVHTSALADNLEILNIDRQFATIFFMLIVLIVVVGGLKALIKITDKLVPCMSFIFIISACAILWMHYEDILPSLALIFKGAFSEQAASGGFLGASIAAAIRWGCSRGMYSSDAGNGISSIAHAQANVKHPVEQAIYGVFEVFFDTIIICTLSALIILSSGVWTDADQNPATLSARVFEQSLGMPGKYLLVLIVVLFGLSTLLSCVYYIYEQAFMLSKSRIVAKLAQILFLAMMYAGGVYEIVNLVIYSDIANAFKIILSMTALLLLSGVISKETKKFFKEA